MLSVRIRWRRRERVVMVARLEARQKASIAFRAACIAPHGAPRLHEVPHTYRSPASSLSRSFRSSSIISAHLLVCDKRHPNEEMTSANDSWRRTTQPLRVRCVA